MRIKIIFFVMFFSFLMIGAAFSNQTEHQKAREYLDDRNEVYFKFTVQGRADIQRFADILSIDKIEGMEIYAYANKNTFEQFENSSVPYTVLIPPSFLDPPPEMSDYKDYDPRGNETFTKYPTYEGYLELIKKFETSYPDICKVFEVGKSIKNRSIMIVRITDNVKNNEREAEPNFLANNGIHGDELTGTMCWARMIEYLCKGYYAHDSRVTNIVNNTDIWINLFSNPDGSYARGNSSVQGATRENSAGVDLNRSFPGPKGSDASLQQETKVMIFVDTSNQFVLGTDFHGGTEAALLPWGYTTNKVHEYDWWQYIAKLYGAKSKYQSQTASSMYTAKGSRIDYPYWGAHFRSVCIEASSTKLISESQFDTYWNKNKESMLTFLEETHKCLNGIVKDEVTKRGIKGVKVFVENVDNDYSFVYTRELHGDYYRPIIKGNYKVTFSHKDYVSKTIDNVSVENGKETKLDVELRPINTAISNSQVAMNDKNFIFSNKSNGSFSIYSPLKNQPEVALYSVTGEKISPLLSRNGQYSVWNGLNMHGMPISSGRYLVSIKIAGTTITKNIFYTRAH